MNHMNTDFFSAGASQHHDLQDALTPYLDAEYDEVSKLDDMFPELSGDEYADAVLSTLS